jgi:hypothetical protein
MISETCVATAAMLLYLAFAGFGFPAGDLLVTVFVNSSRQDSPVQVTGFEPPAKVGDRPRIILRNASDKQIQNFEVGVLLGRADEPDPLVAAGLKWWSSATLVPNATDEVREEAMTSHFLIREAQMAQTTCLHAAVILTQVQFVDGAKWELYEWSKKGHQLWKESIRPESLKSCRNVSDTREALSRMKGPTYAVGSPTHADPSPVTYFSFVCSLGAKEEHPVCQI